MTLTSPRGEVNFALQSTKLKAYIFYELSKYEVKKWS